MWGVEIQRVGGWEGVGICVGWEVVRFLERVTDGMGWENIGVLQQL